MGKFQPAHFNEGFVFSKYTEKDIAPFDRVFDVFKELITHTSGDLDEAFDWLDTLDREYGIFNEAYTLEDFKEDLKKRGYIKDRRQRWEQRNRERQKRFDSEIRKCVASICLRSDLWKAEKDRNWRS